MGRPKNVSMRSDISNGKMLLLLVNTGADINLLKPDNLDKTKQYDPEGRVKMKSEWIHHSEDESSTDRCL
jgi:hypothetical protein